MTGQTDFQTYGDWAVLVIGRFHRQALKAERRVRGGYAPEDVRRLRGALRRLRFAIEIFTPAIHLPDEVTVERIVRFARRLGRLRDHDILHTVLDRFAGPETSESDRESALMLRAHVDRHRHRAIRRAMAMLDGRRYRETMEALDGWLSAPRLLPAASYRMEMVLPDLLLPALARFWMHPGWLVPARREMSGRELAAIHALRRRARHVRYLLDIALPFYPAPVAAYRQELATLQRELGGIQDGSLLPAYLAEHFGRNASTVLARLAGPPAASDGWERLRASHLSVEARRDVRLAIAQPTLPATLPEPLRKSAGWLGMYRWGRSQGKRPGASGRRA